MQTNPKSELLDREPPHNREAELKVVSSVLQNELLIDKIDLRANEFYSPDTAAAWDVLSYLRDNREPVDAERIAIAATERRRSLKAITLVLLECQSPENRTVHHNHYAAVIRENWRRRKIIEATTGLLQEAYESLNPLEEVLAKCEAKLAEVQTGKFKNDPIDLSEALLAALDEIGDIIDRKKVAGCFTGFGSFDSQVGGLFKGELSIIAARPGIGKTSIALQAGLHAAKHGKRVYFGSLEMSHIELAIKMLCGEAGVSNQKVRNGEVYEEDRKAFLAAAESASQCVFKIHDWPQIRIYDIRRACRAMKADLAIVDYLQLVTPSDKNAKRYEQVAQLAKDLKALARELNIPVLTLAQLNREVDKSGKESRPKLSHLRESGDIEQTADMVGLLYRPKHPIEGKGDYAGQSWDAELEIAKNRKGATPTLRLSWSDQRAQYRCFNQYENDFGTNY